MFERVYFRYCLSEEPNYRAGTDTWCLVKAGNEVFFFFFFLKLSGKELSFIVKITWVAFMVIMLMYLHFSESWRDREISRFIVSQLETGIVIFNVLFLLSRLFAPV